MAKQSLKNIHRLIEVATLQVAPDRSFVSDLNSVIERLDADSGRKPSQTYKPSSLSCIRNMYFQVMGIETDGERGDACLIGMAQSGSARHEHIQEAVSKMKDYGIDCEYIDVSAYVQEKGLDHLEIVKQQGNETKLYHKTLNMSFLCDGIIKYKGVYYILEIKTETSRKWQPRIFVDDAHLPQGTCYALCLEINQVLFLYENRDTTDKKAFLLEVTDEMKYELVLSKIEECDQYVKKMTPPPKPKADVLPKKICDYCNYKNACRKAGN